MKDKRKKLEERRQYFRQPMIKAVKVLCTDTGKYIGGQTVNISGSGVLMELNSPSLLVPGQQLQLGISWSSDQTILATDSLKEATVVRSLGHASKQEVAVQFNVNQGVDMEMAVAG